MQNKLIKDIQKYTKFSERISETLPKKENKIERIKCNIS
jgi:hypothetical protein